MTIIKIRKKTNPFVMIEKSAITDERLSWKARGLLVYLLSLPDNWKIHVNDLVKRAPDGRDSVYSGLSELGIAGYLVHKMTREKGKFQAGEYFLFETPQLPSEEGENQSVAPLTAFPDAVKIAEKSTAEPLTGFPDTVKPDTAKPYPENPPLINKHLTKDPNNQIKTEEESADAAFLESLTEEDLILSEKLNIKQQQFIEKQLAAMEKPSAHLSTELEFVLLDKSSFKAAGNDFLKKVNTCLKLIRDGKWTRPVGLIEKKINAQKEKSSVMDAKLRSLLADREHWKKLLETVKKGDGDIVAIHGYEALIQKSEAAISELKQ